MCRDRRVQKLVQSHHFPREGVPEGGGGGGGGWSGVFSWLVCWLLCCRGCLLFFFRCSLGDEASLLRCTWHVHVCASYHCMLRLLRACVRLPTH